MTTEHQGRIPGSVPNLHSPDLLMDTPGCDKGTKPMVPPTHSRPASHLILLVIRCRRGRQQSILSCESEVNLHPSGAGEVVDRHNLVD
jgi:hypothetical protein